MPEPYQWRLGPRKTSNVGSAQAVCDALLVRGRFFVHLFRLVVYLDNSNMRVHFTQCKMGVVRVICYMVCGEDTPLGMPMTFLWSLFEYHSLAAK
jgi:hypothetical protein